MKFSSEISIGQYLISEASPCFVIAEIGVNHNGDMKLAQQLVDAAATAGAHAAKFQLFDTDELIIEQGEKPSYQRKTTGEQESQYQMLKKLEINASQLQSLKCYTESQGLEFLVTPFDEKSFLTLESIGVNAYKIASTDTTNLRFVEKIAATGKPLIVSTGMSYFEEVKVLLERLVQINPHIILLQCTSSYPLKNNEVNLRVLKTFQQQFDILTGFSDHSQGKGAASYAVAMGARVIEKHLTLDCAMKGPDHLASIEPAELKEMIEEIRRVETYLGCADKFPTISESETRQYLQKCLVCNIDLRSGAMLEDAHLLTKRTNGKGISAFYLDQVIGRKLNCAVKQGQVLTLEMLE